MNPLLLAAALVLLPEEQPQAVFAGKPQTVRVVLQNKSDKEFNAELTTRLFQATAATVVPVGEAQPWKTVRVLPGQTVIESATLTFPAVRSGTRFLVQWGDVGRSDVLVFPPDLLTALNQLTGEERPGVFDPDNKLKPALKEAGVKYTDFEIETSDNRLLLVWANRLPESVSSRVKKGADVVWVRPTKAVTAYADRLETGIVVVVPPAMLARLAESPASQMNLLRYAELALQLPENNQP